MEFLAAAGGGMVKRLLGVEAVYICKVRQLVLARTVAYVSSCVLTLIVLPL